MSPAREAGRDSPGSEALDEAIPAAAAVAGGAVGVVLAMQRSAGNRAAGAWIRAAGDPRRRLARSSGGKGSMAPVRSPDRPADMARIAEVVDRVQAGDPEATALAASLSDADMRALSVEERIALIRAMVGGWTMANIAERTVVKVIEAVREEDAGELLAAMREDGSALLKLLESSFQGADYLDFHAGLRLAYLRSLGPAELARRAPTAKRYLWASPGIGELVRGQPWGRIRFESRGFTPDGRIGFNVSYGAQPADKPVVVEPFELVKVVFYFGEPEAGYARGETALMPAVNLSALATLQFRQQLRAGAAVVMLVASGAGFAGATTAVGRAVAGLDFAMGAAALVVDTWRTEIAASPEGRELLEAWDVLQTAMLVFGMARVLWEAPDALRDVSDRWRKWRLQAGRPAGEIALDEEIAELLAQVGAVERLEGRLDDLLSQYELALQRFDADEILERVDDIRALMAKGDVDAAVRQADRLEWDLSLIDEDLGGLATRGPRPFDDATEVLQGKNLQVEGLRKRPPLPPAGAPEIPPNRWQEGFHTPEAVAEQERILELAVVDPRQAGREYQTLVARDLGAEDVQEAFTRPGRRMDVGPAHEFTIEGRNGPFGRSKLDQFWLDLMDRREIMLTLPRLSPAAASQLARLRAQAQEVLGERVYVFVRETAGP